MFSLLVTGKDNFAAFKLQEFGFHIKEKKPRTPPAKVFNKNDYINWKTTTIFL